MFGTTRRPRLGPRSTRLQRGPKWGPPGIVHQHQRGGLFIVVLSVVLGLLFGLPGVVAGAVASLPWVWGLCWPTRCSRLAMPWKGWSAV